MNFCTNCGKNLNETCTFCSGCGTAVSKTKIENNNCTTCGKVFNSDEKFCVGCGTSRGATNPTNQNQMTVTVTEDMKVLSEQARKFNISRANLLGMTALTFINVILLLTGASLHFFFSAAIPTVLAGAASFGYGGASIILGILAFLSACAYLFFWIFSKRFRVFMLIALIFFSIDLLILLILMIASGAFSIIQFAFSIWVMFYLINGTIAWAKLRKASENDFKAALDVASSNEKKNQTVDALNNMINK